MNKNQNKITIQALKETQKALYNDLEAEPDNTYIKEEINIIEHILYKGEINLNELTENELVTLYTCLEYLNDVYFDKQSEENDDDFIFFGFGEKYSNEISQLIQIKMQIEKIFKANGKNIVDFIDGIIEY